MFECRLINHHSFILSMITRNMKPGGPEGPGGAPLRIRPWSPCGPCHPKSPVSPRSPVGPGGPGCPAAPFTPGWPDVLENKSKLNCCVPNLTIFNEINSP